jgi:hypothetical protein
MPYDSERIAKAVQAYLQAELPDALDDVEAAWAATDPVALPEPVTWFEGYKPTFLEMRSDEFPLVALLALSRRPDQAVRAEWGYQKQIVSVTVNFVVVAGDEAAVNKIAHRYAEAITAAMQAQQDFEGFSQTDFEPAVTLSPASRHARSPNDADMGNPDDVDYIMAGAVETTMEGG